MKKIILSTLLLVALTNAVSAIDKNPNRKLLNEISTAMKTSSLVTKWSSKDEKVTFKNFEFNGKSVSACYLAEDELIGFTFPLTSGELPAIIADAVSKKYSDWKISQIILFVDVNAYANYFVQVHKGNNNLVIKINSVGHTSVFIKI